MAREKERGRQREGEKERVKRNPFFTARVQMYCMYCMYCMYINMVLRERGKRENDERISIGQIKRLVNKIPYLKTVNFGHNIGSQAPISTQ